jgi:predicted Zn finger-like uncharacterized protein
MKNECPECGTVYAVTPKDVGRRIVCKKCGSVLVIDDDGFRLESGEPTPQKKKKDAEPSPVIRESEDQEKPEVETEPLPKKAKTPSMNVAALRGFYNRFIDIPTILFGIGAFFVLIHLFMPFVAKAKVERRQGLLQEEQFDHEAALKKLKEKPGNEEKIKTAEENWAKRRDDLNADIKYAEFAGMRSGYLDRYGMLFGFVVLMIGSLGMMRSESGLVKRIFGAFVLGVQMLLVFSSYLGGCGKPPLQ